MTLASPYINNIPLQFAKGNARGFLCQKDGESMYCIENYDLMDPFFMSIVSSCDLWMYLSSYGGLTAGRQNYNNALFPYETDDKIHASSHNTGSKTIVRIHKDNRLIIWEPFSIQGDGIYTIKRNIYKNTPGNKVIFEEINTDLQMTFSYSWMSSDDLGWIRKSSITNFSGHDVQLDITDGLQNLLPWGITRETQSMMSTLMDAYKVSEIVPNSTMALYRMSSIPVDRAEPSEALRTNIVWCDGLDSAQILLSSRQLNSIRRGVEVKSETRIFGQKTAFFTHSTLLLKAKSEQTWFIMADVAKDSNDILAMQHWFQHEKQRTEYIGKTIDQSDSKLRLLVSKADGEQETGDLLNDKRHFANVMFNIMRGGIFEKDYAIEVNDFIKHLQETNKEVYEQYSDLYFALEPVVDLQELMDVAQSQNNNDLKRITLEYLPLSFSRRHGDPSRPWNFFDIRVKNDDGSASLNYQGNWRDIFQNWETLAFSFPAFLPGMITRFLNASTADGYNPYRVMREGFDWEVPEPDNPWAFIGYWGDHQIIYLLRLLEMQEKFFAGSIAQSLNQSVYVYANVPYRIKKYTDIVKNPQDTIVFDKDLNEVILDKTLTLGSDGKLVTAANGAIIRVSFTEKILVTLLTKLSNLVPEAGIWLNTQRPEWNDANNALVGNGTSMVTLYHLRRFIKFMAGILDEAPNNVLQLSDEVLSFFNEINATLQDHKLLLGKPFTDNNRQQFTQQNGLAAEKYRDRIYQGFTGNMMFLDKSDLRSFLTLAQKYIDHSIKANRRSDGMYHAYNLISSSTFSIKNLYLMLEGQVAILNSGVLDPEQSLQLLSALFKSELWRDDQQSFMLYGFRQLPSFVEMNIVPEEKVMNSSLLRKLLKNDDIRIIKKDILGQYHFNASLKNARILQQAIEDLPEHVSAEDKEEVLDIYEDVFNHSSFTGRSGCFYKYEGLGSIYWHMVSKLLLAVGENIIAWSSQDVEKATLEELKKYYYSIKEGIGLYKTPEQYGAFTTDPYSHTPSMMGAQQPGLTGQVKEDILSRFNELGLMVEKGEIKINPVLLLERDFSDGQGLSFSFCNTSFVYNKAKEKAIKIYWASSPEAPLKISSHTIPSELSKEIFYRNDRIMHVLVDL